MARMSRLRLADKKKDWRLEDVSEEELARLAGAEQEMRPDKSYKIDEKGQGSKVKDKR